MKTKFLAVLHVRPDESKKIANLATRVAAKLLENIADFATPNPSLSTLTTQNTKLIDLNAQAKGNTQKKDERDAQALVVYGLLQDEAIYVNGIAKGDKVLVDKSGFDAEKEPENHGIPAVPSIKKVVDGPLAHSAKIILVGPLPKGLRYSVQLALASTPTPPPGGSSDPGSDGDLDPDNLPWEIVLVGKNSRQLVVTGLTRGKGIAVRVKAHDRSLESGWGDLFLFMPR